MKSKKLFILFTALALSVTACNFGKKSSSKAEEPSSSNEPESSEVSSSAPESSESTIAVTALALNKSELSLEETKSETLTVTVTPSNASNTKVNWESSDSEVATVSSLGKVTAKKVGTATITVSSVSNPEVTATCAVTVTVEGGTYGSLNKPLTVAKALALVKEECKEDGDYSKDQLYVKGYVSRQPNYNAEKGFSQNIYLKDDLDAADGEEFLVYTANHDALKIPYKNDLVIVHGWAKLYKTTLEMANKSTEYPTVESVTRGVSTITYSAEHGTFNAEAPKAAENLSEIKFTVTASEGYKVDGVTANGTELTAQDDGSYKVLVTGDMKIVANITEEGVDMKTATMEYKGGTTTNMVADANNAQIVSLDPTLFDVQSSLCGNNYIGLNQNNYIALYNEHADNDNPTANGNILTVSSTRATIKKVAITVNSGSHKEVVMVVKAGDTAVEAGSDGSYEINAGKFSIQNASVKGESCQLRLDKVVISYVLNETVAATAIELDKDTLEVQAEKSAPLKATLTPTNATDVVTWISSDEEIAKVDQSGKVTGVAAGTATVTAFIDANEDGKLDDGELNDTCAITVTPAPTINFGTAEAPLTVAEAKAELDKLGVKVMTKQPMFVKGVVSTSAAFHATFKNAAIWLQSVDGTVEKDFELYSCELDESIDFDTYKAADSLKGFEVVATGYATLYGETYELTNTNDEAGNRINPKILSLKAPSATAVSLDKDTLALIPGGDATLVATLAPANTADTVKWISSDTTVATVEAGKVTAAAVGTATITAFVDANGNDALDEGEVKAECVVTVAAESIAATDVIISASTKEMYVGDTFTLTATVEPSDSTDQLVWSSSDEETATVENGVVTALKTGEVTITATAGECHKECVITITVEPGTVQSNPLTIAQAKALAAELNDDGTEFTAKSYYIHGYAYNITDNSLEETYNNATFLVGDETGDGFSCYRIKPTTDVPAADYDNFKAGAEVLLYGNLKNYHGTIQIASGNILSISFAEIPATGVTMEATKEINVGDQVNMTASLVPVYSSDAIASWESSDQTVASITNKGVVKGLKAGTTTIKAKVSDTIFASCVLTVNAVPATSLDITEESATVKVNELVQLNATVAPDNTTDKIVWASSDETVAKVSASGVVYGIKAGTATITATAGSFSDTCPVTVEAAATYSNKSIDLSTASYTTNTNDKLEWNDNELGVIKFEKNNGTNVTNYYPGGGKTETRVYSKNTLTFTAKEGVSFSRIEFTASSTSYATALGKSTLSNAVIFVSGTKVIVQVIDSTKPVVITVTATSGLKSMNVFYN